jgi:UDP-glucose 4-epimerase
MKVLVTGGAGFIGSHLCEALLEHEYTVTVIDDLSTGSLANLSHVIHHPKLFFIKGSILDEALLAEAAKDVTIIFHLAAAVGVKYIIDNPLESIRIIVRGTENIFNVAHRENIKVILTSTSEVYGKNNGVCLSEEDDRILGSTSITRWSYSCSKALDEFISFAYFRKYGLPVVITRLFNTCGPRQSGQYGMVIPRFINQALDEKPITVYGDGEQIRSFTYVSDTVNALIQLSCHEHCVGEVFNVGGYESVTIKNVAFRIKEKLHSHSPIIYVPYDEAYETGFEDMQRRVPNIAKVKKFINYEPKVGLDELLEKTIEYIVEQRKKIATPV